MNPLETVAVIGNGIIGHGIAQVFAMAGKNVVMIGRDEASLGRALDKIAASLGDFASHDLIARDAIPETLGRIRTSLRLEDAGGAQLVIEAVTEDLKLKLGLFGRLDKICAPSVVLASSSGQPASALITEVAHPERVIATHFWYPPQLIPLVEVCASPKTLIDVTLWVCEVLRAAGKEPAVIDQEIPGFIGNRLQFAMLREAWALWASGAASAEAIDTVVRNSFGRRVGITGPIESADAGGLSTMYHFGKSLMPHLDARPEPDPAIARLIAEGANGIANGKGVYDWSQRDGQALLSARMEELFRWLKADRARK
ncbi:MAG TPA: 3-hydroxyacyl-CoA dehydrogenase NAD-binding domain-containing protein [Dongiaceae bacterium]|nr:3-hydroxyacyl-CoA dehydrogenase NAD-binding domain-containing protein [Dongiaceae bacterium]